MQVLPDESAGSFAFRLAQHRRQSLASLCHELLELSIARNPIDLDRRLARDYGSTLLRAAHASQRAKRLFLLPDDYICSVRNSETRKYTGPVRICTRCLRERKYGRKFWRTIFAAACPQHGVELTNVCPFCQTNIPYFGEMAGMISQFWLESWPTCPACLQLIKSGNPAHPMLIRITRRWISALSGEPQRDYTARGFLHLSARILARFEAEERYRELSKLVAPDSAWPYHVTTALLVRALMRKHTTPNAAYAALGVSFQPDQLASEIVDCP